VRYSFHGKMRFTGQSVDGYVEADTSAEAIDRLADQGIIGVHTVRRDPVHNNNHVVLADGVAMPALPSPSPGVILPRPPVAIANRAFAAPAAGSPELTSLIEKLTSLVGQVEKVLSRPIAYAAGPIRGESRVKRKVGDNEAQNAALKAIFQSNVDLRQNLSKLGSAPASSSAPAPTASAAPAVKMVESHSPDVRPTERPEKSHNPRDNGSANLMPRPIGAAHGMAVHARSA
jgi:hypothetical protein